MGCTYTYTELVHLFRWNSKWLSGVSREQIATVPTLSTTSNQIHLRVHIEVDDAYIETSVLELAGELTWKRHSDGSQTGIIAKSIPSIGCDPSSRSL